MGGALEARQVPAAGGRLVAEANGEIESEDGVLVIKRIHVVLRLTAAEEHRAAAERVHGFFANKCPVYRSLAPAITITTELAFTPE
jgi:uncharacterized OsmC-like protein